MFPHIIGISGRKNSGKKMVANYIWSKTLWIYKIKTFSSLLKDVCSILFGIDPNMDENKEEIIDDRWNRSPHQIYQLVDDALKNVGLQLDEQNFWIKVLAEYYKRTKTNLIIVNVKTPQEIEWIHSQNGIIIRINRDNIPNNDYDLNIKSLEVDYDIPNNETIEDLYHKIDIIFNKKNNNTK